MTYASTDRDPVTIAIYSPGYAVPDTYRATVGEHDISVDEHGLLAIKLPGRSVFYAPGAWTRLDAHVTPEDDE